VRISKVNTRYIAYAVIALIAMLFLFSCSYEKNLAKWCARCSVKDSIVVQIREREKEVVVHDTLKIRSFLPSPCNEMCDSLGNVKKGFTKEVVSDKGTKTILKEQNGGLGISSSIDGVKTKAIVKDTCISKFRTIRAACDQEHTTDWNGFTNIWFWITAALLALYFGFKALKKFILIK
jgi:hypothetical protein